MSVTMLKREGGVCWRGMCNNMRPGVKDSSEVTRVVLPRPPVLEHQIEMVGVGTAAAHDLFTPSVEVLCEALRSTRRCYLGKSEHNLSH